MKLSELIDRVTVEIKPKPVEPYDLHRDIANALPGYAVLVPTHQGDLDPIVLRQSAHGTRGKALVGAFAAVQMAFKQTSFPLIERTNGRESLLEGLQINGMAPVGVVDARSHNAIGANNHTIERCIVFGDFKIAAVAVLGAEYCEHVHSHFKNNRPGGHGLWIATNNRLKHSDAEPFVQSSTGLPIAEGAVSQCVFTSRLSSYTVHGEGSVGVHIGRGVCCVRFENSTVSCNGGIAAFRIGDLGGGAPVEEVRISGMIEGTGMKYGVYVDGPTVNLDCRGLRMKRGVIDKFYACRKVEFLQGDVYPSRDVWVVAG